MICLISCPLATLRLHIAQTTALSAAMRSNHPISITRVFGILIMSIDLKPVDLEGYGLVSWTDSHSCGTAGTAARDRHGGWSRGLIRINETSDICFPALFSRTLVRQLAHPFLPQNQLQQAVQAANKPKIT
jgi:hypothetical protein